jgi:DUF438 domain-containing protein
MSELINNREYRKKAVREIILELHQGRPVQEVKAKFDAIAKDLDPAELSLIEQQLINEGLPIKEVLRLCDVHAAVFRGALEKNPDLAVPQGHPVELFLEENRAIEKLIQQEIRVTLSAFKQATGKEEQETALLLAGQFNLLSDVDKHYRRKEDLIFPFLEKYEITGPPKVMWGADDKNRDLLKQAKTAIRHFASEPKQQVIEQIELTIAQIEEMIFKEEKIFLPMAFQTLAEDEWEQVMQDSDEIGYCLIEPQSGWRPAGKGPLTEKAEGNKATGRETIKFGTGSLTTEQIDLIFKHLPVDITFVDKDGLVKYFSAGKERIFPRTRTIIGRKVENCHPPASVHIVEELIKDFADGKKDQEAFWIHLGDEYVYIRYFAVKDEAGRFAGVLEVTQNIRDIQSITGEKRITD